MESFQKFTDHRGKRYLVFSSGYCPLSPFYPCAFRVGLEKFHSGQHYYETLKARQYHDCEAVQLIAQTRSPKQAADIGSCICQFDETTWKSDEAMEEAMRHVFERCYVPRRFLKETGDDELVFASKFQMHWGTGIEADSHELNVPERWPGRNQLGKILMKIRAELFQS
jgi:ribA/ribD-fused uncharacterized protein